MEEVDWYYIDADRGNAETGPFKLNEIKLLFKEGTINVETYIWHEEADGWQMIKEMSYEGTPLLSLFEL